MEQISKMGLRVKSAGVASVIGTYAAKSPSVIPAGFAKVCEENSWNTQSTWNNLSDQRLPWF